MANEVVIREYKDAGVMKRGDNVPVYSEENLLTTQVVDIGVRSSAFNSETKFVTIDSVATGFWYIFGNSSVDATADLDGNSPLAGNGTRDFAIDSHTHIDTAALT